MTDLDIEYELRRISEGRRGVKLCGFSPGPVSLDEERMIRQLRRRERDEFVLLGR